MKTALLVTFCLLALGYAVLLVRGIRADASPGNRLPTRLQVAIGFVTNFFDTLGIGNFAPTTAWFRYTKMVPDERIPGTLNVGHTLPVVLMACLFITIVKVESTTLLIMLAAAVVGAWLGAGLVAKLPRRAIQIGMGVALLSAAVLMTMGLCELFPLGGQALALTGTKLIFGAIAIAVLGALMTIGVGLYAPCMILISLLGMDPLASFPIMMGACAVLMPAASARFVQAKSYSPRPALGLTLGGLPAVLIAALVVKSLPLDIVKWLVIGVVLYTAAMMLRAATSTASAARKP